MKILGWISIALGITVSASAEISSIDRNLLLKAPELTQGEKLEAFREELRGDGLKIRHVFAEIGWISVEALDVKKVADFFDRFKKDSRFKGVEPGLEVKVNRVPNDPGFSTQKRHLDRVGAPIAWDRSIGRPEVVVAVSDTGIDSAHPDLAENLWRNPREIAGNGIDDDENGAIDDVHGWDFLKQNGEIVDPQGHGTHVAGIVGAKGDNAQGVTGITWNVSLMSARFLNENGMGSIDDGVATLLYAAKNGARIINASWSGEEKRDILVDAIQYAYERGCLVIAAAGNENSSLDLKPRYPAALEHQGVVSVGSMNLDGGKSEFSNYGRLGVDLAAPGADVYSTFARQSYRILSGTSMAAPMVSGVLALLYAVKPEMKVVEARNRLIGTTGYRSNLNDWFSTAGELRADLALSSLFESRLALLPARVSIKKGDQYPLTVSGIATGALTFVSSDTSIATVNAEGLLTARKAGRVQITVTDASGGSAKNEWISVVDMDAGEGPGCSRSSAPSGVQARASAGDALLFLTTLVFLRRGVRRRVRSQRC